MKKLFGTDGIRGVAGDETMNEALAYRLGKAMVSYCRENKIEPKIIIGRDTRISGPGLAAAVVQGINEAGGEAVSVGVIPTAAVAFLVKNEKAGLGLVISASHNPYEYNGLKIFKNNGTKLTDAEEEIMEKLIMAASGSESEISALVSETGTTPNEYNDKYARFLKEISEDSDFIGLKIVLDCANGATSKIAPGLFKSLGAEVAVIFNSPDGQNINKDCGSEHTENLQKAVLAEGADVGLAFDGDGDRLIAVSETGERLTGDHLLYIFARLLKEKNRLTNSLVVSTVMSNLGFIKALKNLGVKYARTDVGDKRVHAALVESGAILGGEESGHIIFLDRQTTGDGILSGLSLLQAMKYFKAPLSKLAEAVILMPKLLLNIEVKSKPELTSVPEIKEVIEATEKYLGQAGRVNVRYSGTEPLCRIMIEGKAETEIKKLAKKIGEIIKRKLN